MRAVHAYYHTLTRGRSNWTYRGNRIKPYVRATSPGARISFRVRVGGMGRVRVTYLKSAEFGLGTVKCWLDDAVARAVKVPGHWDYALNTAKCVSVFGSGGSD